MQIDSQAWPIKGRTYIQLEEPDALLIAYRTESTGIFDPYVYFLLNLDRSTGEVKEYTKEQMLSRWRCVSTLMPCMRDRLKDVLSAREKERSKAKPGSEKEIRYDGVKYSWREIYELFEAICLARA